MIKSRGFRKFRRSRMGMAAAAVIALYLVVCVALLLGAISVEDAMARVGPAHLPGFGGRPDPERRYLNAQFYIDPIERAIRRKKLEQLKEIEVGSLRVADLPVAELKTRIEAAYAIYDELDESEDLDEDAALLPQLEELEKIASSLYTSGSGWRGLKLGLGTDRQGRSILLRGIYAIKIAVQIGLVTAIFSVFFGSFLGAAAAYFGGWVDHVVIWLYSTLMSIPHLVLLAVLIYVFEGHALEGSLFPVYAAFCLTFWIGPCRVVRGEVLRIKELDYVQAASALGVKRLRILIRHVLPNAAHLMFINFSLLFIGAIKSEVILTFLGLGVKGQPSWGIMISQSKYEVVNEFFWQIGAATAFMFGLVLAFNIFTDALQDALDPKHTA